MNLNELTPAQVAEIKEAGGFAGSVKDGINFALGEQATSSSPRTSTPIRGYGSRLRPNVRTSDGELANDPGTLVTKPDLSKHQAAHEAEMAKLKAEELERQEAFAEERSWMDPHKLRAEIEYLTRTVKRLEKSLKTLQKEVKTDGE